MLCFVYIFLFHECFADSVLEISAGGGVANALVHDDKGEEVSGGGEGIAGEGADAFDGAGFGKHLSFGSAAAHSFAKRSIDASHGERGFQMIENGGMTVGVAQETAEEFGRDVVVERKPAAVGELIVVCVKVEAFDQTTDKAHSVFAGSTLPALTVGKLIEKRLRHGVVALLHHQFQNLVDGVSALAQRFGVGGHSAFRERTLPADVGFGKGLAKMRLKRVAVAEKQRRERHGFIVPTPAPAQALVVFEG